MTNFSSLRLAFSGLLLACGMAVSSSASALVLDTTGKKANATLQLSSAAYNAASNHGLSFSAAGNATANSATSFNLPVTEANISVGFFKLTPNSGEAIGSAIIVRKGDNLLGLANFSLDFDSNYVYADVITNGATSNLAIFSFKEKTDLKLGLSGFNLSLYNTLGDLTLTSAAVNSFTSALKLSAGAVADLSKQNWGSVNVNITTALRKPAISDDPFTAAQMIPEPSTYAMMGLGLVGIGFVARRKARAA